jgi:PAP2 superfamily
MRRRSLLRLGAAALTAAAMPLPAQAAIDGSSLVVQWYRLVLELVRHTATYSPPVASRAFAYLGITCYEALTSVSPGMTSLAGQVTALDRLSTATNCDPALVLHTALTVATRHFFDNTGPTGQRAMDAMQAQIDKGFADLPADLASRSTAQGLAVAAHIIAWAQTDGGADVENMGFPMTYTPKKGPSHWQPTSLIRLQQTPLLPHWGQNRPFALTSATTCPLAPPLAYNEDPDSDFYLQAREVYDTVTNLTADQKAIAAFWSDDPMLSPTPPGHWISITLDILADQGADAAHTTDALARLGISLADAFIACWHAKFDVDLLRPVTYIRRVIDPDWQPLLITPPFPEYPSGHSVQSGAAAATLDAIFGADFAFTDATHVDDGFPARDFPNFQTAATEAALSRLYGGIHFRAANENGLQQGRCIGAAAAALRTLT